MTVGVAEGKAAAHSDVAAEPCAAREAVPQQLRPLNCPLATAVASGLKRSDTFRRLVERVGALNGIVYIEARPYVNLRTGQTLNGALSHVVTTAGSHRVLHLMVGVEYGDAPITVMAHELWHVLEVLESPELSMPEAVDALFERLGMHASTGIVETQNALEVERAVRRELAVGRGRTVKDPEPLSVAVVIDDRAHVSPVVLDHAEKEVARIYLHAGLKTTWQTAPALVERTPSETRRPAPAFTVTLIIQPTFLGQPPDTSEFLMGAAPPTTNDCAGPVYVFFDQVIAFSNVQRMEPWLVLGAVMAHEIGHRLLPRRGHSSEGLMRAPWNGTDWEKASLGLLLLTAGEREAIRATISNCQG